MDLNQLYQDLFEAVSVGGIQNIAQTASRVCGQPVVVTDAAFHVLGVCPSTKQNDAIWDIMLEKSYAPQDMVMTFYHEKYMEFANSNPESTLTNWGPVSEKPRVMAPILIKGIVEGYAAMMCPNELYSPSYDEAIRAIAKAAAIEMDRNERNIEIDLSNKPLAKVFISDLFNNLVLTRSQLNAWQNNLGLSAKMCYILLGIKPPDTARQDVLKYLNSTIAARYSNQISIIRENTLYVLLSSPAQNFDRQELENLLRSFHVFCGISRNFTNLLRFASYRQQVETLLNNMPKLYPDRIVFEYDSYLLESMLSVTLDHIEPENFVVPEINLLQTFDRENNTDYLKTLQVYLTHMGNSGESAKVLHIHRNTLLYRIRKIEDILSIHLSNHAKFMELLLSVHLTETNRRFNKQSTEHDL